MSAVGQQALAGNYAAVECDFVHREHLTIRASRDMSSAKPIESRSRRLMRSC
jgi:hypothetical protein